MKRLLWTLVVCVLLVLGVKTFVGDVYRISSSSMEPATHKDEWVFMLYDSSPPERFEVVAMKAKGDVVVKRACGVGGRGGESLLIDSSGDLLIDGARLPPGVRRPQPIVIFDAARHSVAKDFARGGTAFDPWTELEDGTLRLDAREVERGQQLGMLRFHRFLRDGYIDATGARVDGLAEVQDAVIEAEVRALEAGGVLRVELVEQGDTFSFLVDLGQQGLAKAWLMRDAPSRSGEPSRPKMLAETTIPLAFGEWTKLRFANIDNHLTVEWGDGPPVLEVGYDFNTAAFLEISDRSFVERVLLGGEGCVLEVRGIRILRDLHWIASGEFGVGMGIPIQPGHVFLLGDNSADSQDSRFFGALPEGQIVGRPLFVVWPPTAIRGL